MRLHPPSLWPWKSITLGLASALALATPARPTGYYAPEDYLSGGGTRVDLSPEFYWELEVKRLSREFRPQEMPVTRPEVFPPRAPNTESYSLGEAMVRPNELTATIDNDDFEAALKEGRIKPPDPAAAQQHQEDVRACLSDGDAAEPLLGKELPSEFADYHRGALAYNRGPKFYAQARTAWEQLLQRPAAERHYRSVWATFMLGKVALKERKPEASQWFQKARALAHEGFADSLCMAADSYGWEGRSEWKQGHPEKAAPLFLTQLALGDDSAVESLKALIPDRGAGDGQLDYSPSFEEQEKWTDQEKKEYAQKELVDLKAAAREPLLRRLETVHILACETTGYPSDGGTNQKPVESRLARWLRLIKEAGVKTTPDAEYLGWAAYQLGDYPSATHWLELSPEDSPAGSWLRAKLQRRAGKLTEAAQSMVQAWKTMQMASTYTGWQPAPEEKPPAEEGDKVEASESDGEEDEDKGPSNNEGWSFSQHASGNLAALQLARGEFLQAFSTFETGDMWVDAAFVAESVLTTEELKALVDNRGGPPEIKKATYPFNSAAALRYLLGRRLVREDKYAEAAPYLKAPYDKLVAVYAKALREGADEKLPKPWRARAWFKAAWIARMKGMELMGTEVAPDGFINEGEFEVDAVAQERLTGKIVPQSEGNQSLKAKPISLKPTKEEVERLKKNRPSPDVRFHYRVVAAALAMKAAALLPDNTPELADVINTSGVWLSREDKLADQHLAALLKRCPKTEIARESKAKHRCVWQEGPWSSREDAAHEALMKELDPEKTP